LVLLWRVRKAARKIPDMVWAADLIAMIQVSYLAFFVSGAALSMAYYDLVYLFIGIALALDQMVKAYRNNPAKAVIDAPGTVAVRNGKWRAGALETI
jgi:hypothetical protein